jgi:hypothetical protein
MLRLLSSSDHAWLSHQRYSKVGHFRRERATIYFQYLGDLCRDLRALPLWAARRDAEAFRAGLKMHRMLLHLALEGLLSYIGIRRRDGSLVARTFEKLGSLLSAAA